VSRVRLAEQRNLWSTRKMAVRSELEGLLIEQVCVRSSRTEPTGPSELALSDADLAVFRSFGRLYRLLGLIPTTDVSTSQVDSCWRDFLELALRVFEGLHPEPFSTTALISLELSGVPTSAKLKLADLWTTFLPLVLWILRQQDSASVALPMRGGGGKRRTVVGFVGGAASGKTHTAQLLSHLIGIASSQPAELTGVAAVAECPSDVVSMDGYHLANATLRERWASSGLRGHFPRHESALTRTPLGVEDLSKAVASDGLAHALGQEPLSSFKGSIESIDAHTFAADLESLQFADDVLLAAYDRRIRDVVPGSVPVTKQHTIVLVEGLYLLQGAPGVDPPEFVSESAWGDWRRVWNALDCVVFLDVAASACRSRFVQRQEARGIPTADALAKYDHFDGVIWQDLAEHRRAADLVLSFEDDSVASVAIHATEDEFRFEFPPLPAPSMSAPPPPPLKPKTMRNTALAVPVRVLFLGLNPALQRTMVMPDHAEGGSSAWQRGGVHRVQQTLVSFGGKGQLAAFGASQLGVPTVVNVVQPVAGAQGSELLRLQTASCAPKGVEPVTLVVDRPDASTRTCITLLDHSPQCPPSEVATEFIEPSMVLASEDVERLGELIRGSIVPAHAEDDDETIALSGLGLMGTVPKGCESLYSDAVVAASELTSPLGRSLGGLTPNGEPIVLLDGYTGEGVSRALETRAVHVIKINAIELLSLASKIPGREDSTRQRFEALQRAALAVHQEFGVRVIAVTDGPNVAYMFDFRPVVALRASLAAARRDGAPTTPSTSPLKRASVVLQAAAARHRLSGVVPSRPLAGAPTVEGTPASLHGCQVFASHRVQLPSLHRPLCNPIGAGDTCSGVMLHCLTRGMEPLVAFVHGLAAASASCMTMAPAEFDVASDMPKVLEQIRVESWRDVSLSNYADAEPDDE
jgi:pantothenate kinase/fructose-1-phosphate kinase PfkB-like protein